jgi:hypothetical protein
MLSNSQLPVEVSENSFWEIWYSQNMMTGSFSSLMPVDLRDASGVSPGAPPGGWYVSPLHAVSLPVQQKVIITGWLRSGGAMCRGGLSPGGRRAKGITFLISSLQSPSSSVIPVDEQPLYAWQVPHPQSKPPMILISFLAAHQCQSRCASHNIPKLCH